MKAKNVAAIIQARTSSERLPGKVLLKIGEHKVIEWVINRTKKSALCEKIILTTTDENIDDELVKISSNFGIYYHRGSKNDVLDRYIKAAKNFGVSTIVRICADRPFVDPQFIDNAIRHYNNSFADIVFNHNSFQNSCWPKGFGVEVFSLKLLERISSLKPTDFQKEHVSLYVWDNYKKFKIISSPYEFAEQNKLKEIKLDLDTPEEYSILQLIGQQIDLLAPSKQIINKWQSITCT